MREAMFRGLSMQVWEWRAALIVLCIAVFVIRITGPTELEGYAQHRNVGYVLDLLWHGDWLIQYDIEGRIFSKPPLHTWFAAAFAGVLGMDRLALALPSFFAVLALAGLVFEVGRRRFGLLAGGSAGLAMLLAPMMAKQIALVRSDALFALAIALAAFAALRAWERGRGWWVFWLAAGVATLIKGPLGLVLAAGGLLAWLWERRGGHAPPSLRGSHGLGVVLYLLVPLAWFVPAWLQAGQPLIDKMFFGELLGHAVGAGKDRVFGENLVRPTLFFLARFLPFSLFAFYAIWRVVRVPAEDARERRFERFLTVWIAFGLLLFSFAAHHRADLLLPLWAPAAVLAGREVSRLATWWMTRKETLRPHAFVAGFVLVHAFMLAAVYANYHHPFGGREENTRYAENVRAAALALLASEIDPHQIEHVDTPVTLQMYLGTHRLWLSLPERAALPERQAQFWLASERITPADLGLSAPDYLVETSFEWRESPNASPLLRVFRVQPLQGNKASSS